MQITITGVKHLQERIAKYSKLETDCYVLVKRLCEVGEPIIRNWHGNHASITIEPIEKGYVLKAEGEDILFIEFGTGSATGSMSSFYDQVPAVVRPGSWSEAHQGEYAKTGGFPVGYWHFGGQRYTQTPPHPAFYYAYQSMVEALPRIASEVFAT